MHFGQRRQNKLKVKARRYTCGPLLYFTLWELYPFNIGPQRNQSFVNMLITPFYLLDVVNG